MQATGARLNISLDLFESSVGDNSTTAVLGSIEGDFEVVIVVLCAGILILCGSPSVCGFRWRSGVARNQTMHLTTYALRGVPSTSNMHHLAVYRVFLNYSMNYQV